MERAGGSAEDLNHAEQGISWDSHNRSLQDNNGTLNIKGTAIDGVNNGTSSIAGLLPAFQRLPDTVIELVLYTVDPDTFASLLLVNRRWRKVSETPSLYAHHLLHCPSFARAYFVPLEEVTAYGLARLRGLFAQEVVRNLFEAYLRPQQTTLKLISTSATSSAAFPQGEAFRFSFSLLGHWVIATNSSRIYIVDVRQSSPTVRREFSLGSKPTAVDVLDNGSILAVLTRDHQVNVYDIRYGGARLLRSLSLENPGKAIALSPDGSVLASASEGAIEVISLAEGANGTDRRAVAGNGMDRLTFSPDGSQILGTSTGSNESKTMLIAASVYSTDYHDSDEEEIHATPSQVWTTQILFPTRFRDCSHATFLHTKAGHAWLFAYDKIADTLGILDVNEMKYMRTIFPLPRATQSASWPAISSTPMASKSGDVVAVVQSNRRILLYGIPEKIQPPADSAHLVGQARVNGYSAAMRTPQELVPKLRIAAKMAATVEGVSEVKWSSLVEDTRKGSSLRRLIAVAPGGVSESTDDTTVIPVDGGRILIFDFDYSTRDGESTTITIEVGDAAPEVLEEAVSDIEREVSLTRRRTIAQASVAQRRDSRLGRSITSASNTSRRRESYPSPILSRTGQETLHPPVLRRSSTSEEFPRRRSSATDDGSTMQAAQAALDDPYSPSQPRSQVAIQRAATAAAMVPRRHLHAAPLIPLQYRRADGRRELPHESDADNWVPPPPPYTPDADLPLPDHLRVFLLPQGGATVRRVPKVTTSPATAQTAHVGNQSAVLERTIQHPRGPSRTSFPNSAPDTRHTQDSQHIPGLNRAGKSTAVNGSDTQPSLPKHSESRAVIHAENAPSDAHLGSIQHTPNPSINSFSGGREGRPQQQLGFPPLGPSLNIQPSYSLDIPSGGMMSAQALDSVPVFEHEYAPDREPRQTREIPDTEPLHSLLTRHSSSAKASSSSLPLPALADMSTSSSLGRATTLSNSIALLQNDQRSPSSRQAPTVPSRDTPFAGVLPSVEQSANLHRLVSKHQHRPMLYSGSRSSSHHHSESIDPGAAVGASRPDIFPNDDLRPPGPTNLTQTEYQAANTGTSVGSRNNSPGSRVYKGPSATEKRRQRQSSNILDTVPSVGSLIRVVSKRRKSRSRSRDVSAGVGTGRGGIRGALAAGAVVKTRSVRRVPSRAERGHRADVLGKKGRTWSGKRKSTERQGEETGVRNEAWADIDRSAQMVQQEKKSGRCILM